MSQRSLTTILVLWLASCGALFVTLLSAPDTNDVAGFVIAMVILQIPPFVGVACSEDSRPLSPGSCVAVALPTAIVGAFVTFFVSGTVAATVWSGPFDFTAIYIALVGAVIGFVLYGVPLGFYLGQRPHPIAARRAFLVLGLVNLLAMAVSLCARQGDVELVVVMGVPVLYVVPMLVASWRRRPDPAPIARVVR
jgi:hypothetical protein